MSLEKPKWKILFKNKFKTLIDVLNDDIDEDYEVFQVLNYNTTEEKILLKKKENNNYNNSPSSLPSYKRTDENGYPISQTEDLTN